MTEILKDMQGRDGADSEYTVPEQAQESDGRDVRRRAHVGEWLVEPGPPGTRTWRWGRITAVLPDGRHLLVRWYGDSHETAVLPSVDAAVASPDHVPQWAGDAIGLLPMV